MLLFPKCRLSAAASLLAPDNGWFTVADDSFAVAPVQIGLLNDMVLGVHPVHAAASVVDGEAVGPEKVRVRDDAPVGSVHVGILDARCVAPVGPVDLPKERRASGSIEERS